MRLNNFLTTEISGVIYAKSYFTRHMLEDFLHDIGRDTSRAAALGSIDDDEFHFGDDEAFREKRRRISALRPSEIQSIQFARGPVLLSAPRLCAAMRRELRRRLQDPSDRHQED